DRPQERRPREHERVEHPRAQRGEDEHEGVRQAEAPGRLDFRRDAEEGAQPEEHHQREVVHEQRRDEDPCEVAHAVTSARRFRSSMTHARPSSAMPSVRKPPGGIIMNTHGSNRGPNRSCPRMLPLPSTSRIVLRRHSERVNPAPIPNPSATARYTGTLAANASARPSSRQFATMSGMNGPSALLMSGNVAARSMSARVTNVAMMRMYDVIRTSFAMYFRKSETNSPDPTSTNVVAMPIASPLASTFVTAIVGHIPRNWTRTGFSRPMPRHTSAKTVAGGGAPGTIAGALDGGTDTSPVTGTAVTAGLRDRLHLARFAGDERLHALERRDAPGELRAKRLVHLDLVAESRRLLLVEHLVSGEGTGGRIETDHQREQLLEARLGGDDGDTDARAGGVESDERFRQLANVRSRGRSRRHGVADKIERVPAGGCLEHLAHRAVDLLAGVLLDRRQRDVVDHDHEPARSGAGDGECREQLPRRRHLLGRRGWRRAVLVLMRRRHAVVLIDVPNTRGCVARLM